MDFDDSVGHVRPLVPRNGSYEWVSISNDNRSRNERRAVANETTEASDRGWYSTGSEQVPLKSANDAEAGTVIVAPKQNWPDLPQKRRYKTTEVKCSEPGTYVLDVAVKLVEDGHQVAAVSAASAHHVGGGFTSGGRHASEEAVCVQSTLYRCLRHAWRQTGVPEGVGYIPEDGVVLSPRVEVFREGTRRGYAPLPKPWELTCMVSVAMPNLNERVRDAPLWKRPSAKEYRAAIKQRWRATLHAAFSAGASHIVCPDAGCGVYRNDPAIVGSALGEVLCSEYFGHFESLWIVGGAAFQSAVKAAADVPQKSEESSLGKLKGRFVKRMGSSDKNDKAKDKVGGLDSPGTPAELKVESPPILSNSSTSRFRLPWTPKRKRAMWKRMMSSSTTASSVDLDDPDVHVSVSEANIVWSKQTSGATSDDCPSDGTSGTGDASPLKSADADKVWIHRHTNVDAALLKSKLEALCTDACKRGEGLISLGEPPQTREPLASAKRRSALDGIDDMSGDAFAPKASAILRPGKQLLKVEASAAVGGLEFTNSNSENDESCECALHQSTNFNPGVQRNMNKFKAADVSSKNRL